jgi:glycerate kinase
MRVLVAPDKFKGTFGAAEVARAFGKGVAAAGFEADLMPLADGGEGTAAVLVASLGGEWRRVRVHDPLGREIDAELALLPDGTTAIVDASAASGLGRLASSERDPLVATTYGTGELIAAAASAGATRVLVGAGGTATVDGGAGALEALAAAGVSVQIDVLCDVRTSWSAAPALFGAQKGAGPDAIAELEQRLERLAARALRDPRGIASTGCGGGLSGGLYAFAGATLLPGAATVCGLVGFDERLAGADLVLTGEGRLDRQTLEGKVVAEVAGRARAAAVPCVAIVGASELDEASWRALGLADVRAASTRAELVAVAREISALAGA